MPADAVDLGSGISPTEPDWTREAKDFFQWAPSRSLLASIRSYQHWRQRRGPVASLLRKTAVVRHRFWSVVTGAEIPINSRIAGGLMIPHPNGIVVHPEAVIGPNCLILQQVTIGVGRGGVPTLKGHVDLGAGAKVLGGIVLDDHSSAGANAVVVHDVPAGALVLGVPAVVVRIGPPVMGTDGAAS